MHVLAAIADRPGAELALRPVVLDAPRADEVLVRVVATGICHTDLVVRDGKLPTPFPVVLGHEGAGVVKAVGSAVDGIVPGDHVLATFDSCGSCPACRRHAPCHCRTFFPRNFLGRRPDGTTTIADDGGPVHGSFFGQSSFATHALCTRANVVKVPRDAPLDLMAPLGCAVQTGAGAILNSLRVPASASVAILGVGAVGLAAVMAARVSGAGVIVAVDRNASRLALAGELGATQTVDTAATDMARALADLAPDGVDFVLDTTGQPSLIAAAIECLGAGGACGVLGAAPSGDAELALNYRRFLLGGKRLVGIIEGDSDPAAFLPVLVDMVLDGRMPMDRIVTRYEFADINRALADIDAGRVVKPVLMMP